MNRNGTPSGNEPTIAKGFSRFAHDFIELSELQVELLKIDAAESARLLRVNLVLAIGAILLALGAIPVVLLAIAEALSQYAGWPRTWALLAAAAVGMGASALLLLLVWKNFRQGTADFQRSRDEFNRNIHWLKTSLRAKDEKASRTDIPRM